MNLFRLKGGGGGGVALMHVYVWEHIASPLLQNHLMDAYKTW